MSVDDVTESPRAFKTRVDAAIEDGKDAHAIFEITTDANLEELRASIKALEYRLVGLEARVYGPAPVPPATITYLTCGTPMLNSMRHYTPTCEETS